MNDPIDENESRLQNPRFWEELQQTFEAAVGLLHDLAESQGLESAVPREEVVRDEEARVDELARLHPLATEAEEYAARVDHWFRGARGAVEAWGAAVTSSADSDRAAADVEAQADDLQDAFETIADARYRIGVKLLRALRTRLRNESDILSTIPGAAEKAAVEAYVLVEDSIKHWMRLREILPAEEDAVLSLLAALGRIRDGVEEEFVDAIGDQTDVTHVAANRDPDSTPIEE